MEARKTKKFVLSQEPLVSEAAQYVFEEKARQGNQSLSSLLGKRYRFEYMSCFDDYCNRLAREQVNPADSLLVELVRVRNIADQANCIFWQLIETHENSSASTRGMHHVAVSSVKKGLEKYQQQMPHHLKDSQLLRMHCAAVRIRLFEPGTSSGGFTTQQPPFNRCQLIWDCLESTGMMCSAFRAIPIECYPYLTFDTILHLALALIKSSRLLFMTEETWDAQTARNIYKLPDTLQHLSNLFESASRLGHPRCGIRLHDRLIFSDYAHSYRSMELCYLARTDTTVSPGPDSVPFVEDDGGQSWRAFEMWPQLLDIAPDALYGPVGHPL
ncbi:hypothetical protein V2A60_007240 [Cordyceps javanica]